MPWSESVAKAISALPVVPVNAVLAKRLYTLLDLTSLNDTDTDASVALFAEKARSALGEVAAVCVYPAFVSPVAAQLAGSPVAIATVVNFPTGDASLETVLIDINHALTRGATEIDVVFPYQRYLAGERAYAQSFVAACKAACGESVPLKVILETGVLQDLAVIADAAHDAFMNGADFVKTSTGKVPLGASLAATAVMLMVAKQLQPECHRPLGVKVSGGVRSIPDAAAYVALADAVWGREHVTSATFRIGASRLVDELLAFA